MGADGAPRVEVEGVLAAVRARDVEVILVGDEERLRGELRALGGSGKGLTVRHAPDVITMDDAPSMAVKQKKKSSMRVCFDLVKAGEAAAGGSAGETRGPRGRRGVARGRAPAGRP